MLYVCLLSCCFCLHLLLLPPQRSPPAQSACPRAPVAASPWRTSRWRQSQPSPTISSRKACSKVPYTLLLVGSCCWRVVVPQAQQYQQEQQALLGVSAAAARAAAAGVAVSGGVTAAAGDGRWCGRRGLLCWCCAPGVLGCSTSSSSACGLGSSSCRSSCGASAAFWASVLDVATLHAYVCQSHVSRQLPYEQVVPFRASCNNRRCCQASQLEGTARTSEQQVHLLVARQTSPQLVTQATPNPRAQTCS
jgi:hypothetical protein